VSTVFDTLITLELEHMYIPISTCLSMLRWLRLYITGSSYMNRLVHQLENKYYWIVTEGC